MITIMKEFFFEAAHRLPLHNGECSNLHGHNYRVEITVSSQNGGLERVGPETGMIVDPDVLSSVVNGILRDGRICGKDTIPFKYSTILWTEDPLYTYLKDGLDKGEFHGMRLFGMVEQPTTENIAALLAALIQVELEYRDLELYVTQVKLWETPESGATWDFYEQAEERICQ